MCPLLTVSLYIILRIFGKVLITKKDFNCRSGVTDNFLVHAHLVKVKVLDIYL